MADAQNPPDWESLYDQLLARQKAVADLESMQAAGKLSEAELSALQEEIREVRLLSDAVYERAFRLVELRLRSSGASTHYRGTRSSARKGTALLPLRNC